MDYQKCIFITLVYLNSSYLHKAFEQAEEMDTQTSGSGRFKTKLTKCEITSNIVTFHLY